MIRKSSLGNFFFKGDLSPTEADLPEKEASIAEEHHDQAGASAGKPKSGEKSFMICEYRNLQLRFHGGQKNDIRIFEN